MGGLPWGFLCGTSGRKDQCIVPCHSCHIYGIWTSRSKKVWGMLKSHQLVVAMQVTKGGALFIRKAGSHYVILLHCETLLQVLLGIYCKRFYGIPLFTILLLFYVFGCNSKCLNDTNTEWAIPEKLLSFLLYPWKFHIFNPFPLPPLFVFFHYSVCTVISDCSHPFDISTFTNTVSQEYIYCNWKYIFERSFVEIKNFYFSIKEVTILKS